MKAGKLGLILFMVLMPAWLSAQSHKQVTVTITQQTDRGTVVIDTTFYTDEEVDLDAVLEDLNTTGVREQSIVIRGNLLEKKTQNGSRVAVVRPKSSNGSPVLGVYLDDHADVAQGVKISSVTDGGAAQNAGIQGGDILLRVGESWVNSEADVVQAKRYFSPGDAVELEYLPKGSGKVTLGVYLDTDTRLDRGIRLTGVTEGGAAQRAGLQKGDVLLQVGSRSTNSYQEVLDAKKGLRADESVEVVYLRGNRRTNTVLSFIEGGGNASNNYSYNYDYDYDYDQNNQNHNENHNNTDTWQFDQNQNWNWDNDVVNGDRAFLGVYPEDLTRSLAEELDLREAYGVYVDGVVEGSAAEQAGLQEGDVIVGFDDEDIPNADALTDYLSQLEPGQRLRIAYYRDGRLRRTVASLSRQQTTDNSWQPSGKMVAEQKAFLGVNLVDDARNGVRISSVVNNSAAQQAGLRKGDVITGMNGQDIDDYDDLKRVMKSFQPGQTIRLNYRRNGSEERTRVTLGSKTVERWVKP